MSGGRVVGRLRAPREADVARVLRRAPPRLGHPLPAHLRTDVLRCCGGLGTRAAAAAEERLASVGVQFVSRRLSPVNDCKDNNGQATSSCTLADAFFSNSRNKLCSIGPPPVETFSVTVATACPSGFSPSNVRTQFSPPNATCSAGGTSTVTIGCGAVVVGNISCRIVADCSAN